MVETIEIMIEQNHIEQGVPGDCGRCVIALALRDHFEGGYKTACVEEGKGFLTVDDREYVFELPLEANESTSPGSTTVTKSSHAPSPSSAAERGGGEPEPENKPVRSSSQRAAQILIRDSPSDD